MSLTKEYFHLQQSAESEFGPNAIVLMEIGSFMECYATDSIGHARRVASALNMVMTKKNKKFPVSETNPYMVGFPSSSHEKNIPVLLSNGLTVVWYSQIAEKGHIRREKTRVITPGTYLPKDDDGYHVCCVSASAAAVIDTSVGKVILHTIRSLEQLRWFKEMYNPVETLVQEYPEAHEMFKDSLISFSNGNDYKDKVVVQAILERAYDNVFRDLPEFNNVLACLMDFVWTCHPAALKDIQYPRLADSDRMTLHNNLIPQLDVLTTSRGQGLFGLLKKYTHTAMGRRALRAKLLAPLTSADKIQEELDRVERAFDELRYTRELAKIPDMERALKALSTHVSVASLRDFHEGVFQMLDLFPNPSLSDAFAHARDATFSEDPELCTIRTRIQDARQALDKELTEPWFHNCKMDTFTIVTTTKRATTLHQNYPSVLRLRPLNSTTTCVYTDKTNRLCAILSESTEAEMQRVAEKVKEWVAEIQDKHIPALCDCIQKVTELDCAVARAACAQDLGLVRPTICASFEESFVQGQNVRHPLIPHYIGNDVNLGNGLLLYGINGSGKTCHAKSIALNVILAQAGFFVFADALTVAPFTKMFARINCDDDVYQGLSSFSVEMTELRSILRLADERSLIIGDEMCKGTEDMSAVALVASCVRWIHDRKVKFVFATHQHKLPELVPEDIQIKHVRTEHRGGNVVFLRKLAEGPGDTMYGIEVARYLLGLPEIANRAMEIRNALVGRGDGRIKKSRYNKKVTVTACQACGTTTDLHTHHVVPQASFEKSQRKQMNDKDNLMVLCHTCHDKVHHDELVIETLDTIQGKKNKIIRC
jgi:DNA mismatch repair protein MutS